MQLLHERIRRVLAAAGTWVGAAAALTIVVSSCGGRIDEGSGSGAYGASLVPGSSGSGGGPGGQSSSGSTTAPDASTPGAPRPTGTTTPGTPGAPVQGTACWESQLPAEVQPIVPRATTAATCSAASAYSQWVNYVGGDAGQGDVRDHFVGRWVACSGSGSLSPLPHAGVEFGANGRWRLLVTDSTGTLVPAGSNAGSTEGHYYALSGGQLDVSDQGSTRIFFAKVSVGTDAVEFVGYTGAGPGTLYARATPSAANGRDNPPSTTDGRCSMVGTWDAQVTSASPAGTFSFDEAGNFVGAGGSADLCTSHTMYGTYLLATGMFWLTENVNMGACSWWFDAGYPATFDATCTHLTITQHLDNCTGGRNYFNGTTTLVKRP
jgi:hypothetical protein